jgi:hypothetical protein
MNDDKQEAVPPTLAARRAALIARCEIERTHLGREVSNMRSPHVLTGGSLLESFTGGRFKVPLAVLGTVLGVVAASPAGMTPIIRVGMSVYRLAKSALLMLRAKAA